MKLDTKTITELQREIDEARASGRGGIFVPNDTAQWLLEAIHALAATVEPEDKRKTKTRH